jgi:photosystem II stability/assembly factor-like uncharacterized protein
MSSPRTSSRRVGLVVVAAGLILAALSPASARPRPAAPRPPVISPYQFRDINPNFSDLSDADGSSGGRVNHLAGVKGDNQTFYAATEWGGLYKSTNGGLNWTHLSFHRPMVTWDVAVEPTNPLKVYATSLFDGRVNSLSGINVSDDGGATWAHPATADPPVDTDCAVAQDEPTAFGLSIRPDAPDQVFVGTGCGVAVSLDGGQTWTYRDPSPDKPGMPYVTDALAQPAIGRRSARVTVCSNEGNFYSTDLGTNWHGPYGPGGFQRCTLSASPDEPYVLFLTMNKSLYESDDGGVTWTNLHSPDSRIQGRVPFVATNQRSTQIGGPNWFDVWYGDVHLFRGTCITPTPKAQGGPPRCPMGNLSLRHLESPGQPALGIDLGPGLEPADPPPLGWDGPFTRTAGAHDDVGDIVFDTEDSTDSCPTIFASDGGVHRNTATKDCQTPEWLRSNWGLHALWLWGMDGAHQSGIKQEDLYLEPQDNGPFATRDAGATPPTWSNRTCCDGFDVASDPSRVLSSICCFKPAFEPTVLLQPAGMVGGGEINAQLPGVVRGFRLIDEFDRWGDKKYVLVTADPAVYVTKDITANPIVWTQLGAASTPQYACGVRASVGSRGQPVFYVQSGSCGGEYGGTLWKYVGTAPGGTWQQIDSSDGLTGGFNIWNVDPNDPSRLYASNDDPAGPRMVFSNDGGMTWEDDLGLTALMDGNGAFKYRNEDGQVPGKGLNGYLQPSLVAFDPGHPGVIVAGGNDSGVFLSTNDGHDWVVLDSPLGSGTGRVARPHLPRPYFAYFDHDPVGTMYLFIGTVGRGVWRISAPDPTLGLDPSLGPPGVGFRAIGLAWDPIGPVEIRFDGELIGRAVTDERGSFSVDLTVPADAEPGDHVVKAVSEKAGLAVEATFTVTP